MRRLARPSLPSRPSRRSRSTAAAIGLFAMLAVAAAGAAPGCARPEPAKSYPVKGQILAVDQARQQITIKHEDIPGLMPGMTMSFPVARPELLNGREPGELVTATLEVTDALGRLTSIEHTGFSPLPTDTNAAAMAATMLSVGDAVPDAAFVDQANARRSFSEWRGSVTLLTFIYTRCPLPNFCPLMDRNFARIQQAIAAEAGLRGRVKLVSISFDPDHDTPDVLAAHAKELKADPAIWTFLTGDRATIDRFAAQMGVAVMRPAGDSQITHNLRTILIGADGRIAYVYPGNEWTTDAVLTALRAAATAIRVP